MSIKKRLGNIFRKKPIVIPSTKVIHITEKGNPTQWRKRTERKKVAGRRNK